MQNLCVTNSFFKTRPQHKVAWIHPRSKHWHQFDLILVRRCHINDVLLTRSYHSADCNSDHLLVCCKMHIPKKFMHKSKETRKVLLDIVEMHDPDQVKKFSALMQSILSCPNISASKSWSRIQKIIYQNSLESFEKKNTC